MEFFYLLLTSVCMKCVSRTCSSDTIPEFVHGNAGEKQPFNDQASSECFFHLMEKNSNLKG